uniref:Uncharacterized protein n=1 Tax=Candidatus Kentrum sp. FM TaxID=2126340 RepID=A0A450T389_9GAMM|nr:MAG: hypothetical protein BECKFM1743C_GA0114222_102864 [Candidatus Kentron sp. FM]
MTNLYAWNTARADPVAYPNVRGARLFHPTRGRQFFGCSIHPSPNKKIRPLEIPPWKVYLSRLSNLQMAHHRILPRSCRQYLYRQTGLARQLRLESIEGL